MFQNLSDITARGFLLLLLSLTLYGCKKDSDSGRFELEASGYQNYTISGTVIFDSYPPPDSSFSYFVIEMSSFDEELLFVIIKKSGFQSGSYPLCLRDIYEACFSMSNTSPVEGNRIFLEAGNLEITKSTGNQIVGEIYLEGFVSEFNFSPPLGDVILNIRFSAIPGEQQSFVPANE